MGDNLLDSHRPLQPLLGLPKNFLDKDHIAQNPRIRLRPFTVFLIPPDVPRLSPFQQIPSTPVGRDPPCWKTSIIPGLSSAKEWSPVLSRHDGHSMDSLLAPEQYLITPDSNGYSGLIPINRNPRLPGQLCSAPEKGALFLF